MPGRDVEQLLMLRHLGVQDKKGPHVSGMFHHVVEVHMTEMYTAVQYFGLLDYLITFHDCTISSLNLLVQWITSNPSCWSLQFLLLCHTKEDF